MDVKSLNYPLRIFAEIVAQNVLARSQTFGFCVSYQTQHTDVTIQEDRRDKLRCHPAIIRTRIDKTICVGFVT